MQPEHRRARAGRARSCATRDEGARPARRRAPSVTVDGARSRRSAPGLLVLLGVTHATTRRSADRLADKVRALRVFADADGRMNEPLGDREVLVVSQFTLYGDARKGNRPSLRRRRAPRSVAEPLYERFRERLGAQRRRLRRAHGGRARQRRAGDAAAGAVAWPAPLWHPSPDSSSASPPSRRRRACPTAAGPSSCRPSSWPPACASTARARSSASRARSPGSPTARYGGRTYVPGDRPHRHGLRAVRPRLVRARDADGEPTDFARRRRLHRRDRRGQPRLGDRPLRRGRRRAGAASTATSRR